MSANRRPILGVGIAVLTAVLFAGCGKKPAATVNGRVIPRDRFYQTLERLQGPQVMTQLILEEVVLQEAEQKKMMPTEAEITRQVAEVKKTEQGRGTDAESLRRGVTVSMALKNLVFQGVPKPTDAELKKFYDESAARGEFDQSEAVQALRAVFATKDEADKARETLLKGVAFDVIAGKSIDLTGIRQRGNQLPPLVGKGKDGPFAFPGVGANGQPLPAEELLGKGIAEQVFRLPEKGVLVADCARPKGFQVIQVSMHQIAKRYSFQEVKDSLGDRVRVQKLADKNHDGPKTQDPSQVFAFYQAKLVSDLRKKADIKVQVRSLRNLPNQEQAWPAAPTAQAPTGGPR